MRTQVLILLGLVTINQAVQLQKHHHRHHAQLHGDEKKEDKKEEKKDPKQVAEEAEEDAKAEAAEKASQPDPENRKKKDTFKNPYWNPWVHGADHIVAHSNQDVYQNGNPAGYGLNQKRHSHRHSHQHRQSNTGSRYGPLDPPYEPWNIDNHHASDEKTWSSGAPSGYAVEPLEAKGSKAQLPSNFMAKNGSRYGPLDPPYKPWNIDNHHASDEKSWGEDAPKDFVIDTLKQTPPKGLMQKEGSRYGPLDPPYKPWNIDNHHASDEKSWGEDAPKDFVIDTLKQTPPKGLFQKEKEGSRYGPLDPPFKPWNIDNHHASDEKTWSSGAPSGYAVEPLVAKK